MKASPPVRGRDGDVSRWLEAARGGSNEALGQLFETSRRFLLKVAEKQLDGPLRTKEGASDLVQQSFLEAQASFGGFHGVSERELLRWLRRILLNNVSNLNRSFRGTTKRQLDREVPFHQLVDRDPPGSEPTPSRIAMVCEQLEALERALERIPDVDRRVITLRQTHRFTFEKIGEMMGRSPDATRKLWARAIERLQDEMEAKSKSS